MEATVTTQNRTGFVGGSDSPVIAGLSKWKTPLELWYEKRGLMAPDDLSDKEVVHFGNVLEDTVALEFSRRTGKTVHRVNFAKVHPDYGWMRAQLDRRVVGESAVVECKTTNPFSFRSDEWGAPGTDQVPEYYLVQCQHQLAVTGYELAYLAVLVGGQKFAHYIIPRDEGLIGSLTALEVDFWQAVEDGIEPVADYEHPSTLEFMKRRYAGTNGRAVKLPIDAADLKIRDAELASTISAAKTERDEIKARLLGMIGEYAVGLLPDGTGWTRRLISKKGHVVKPSEYWDMRFSKNPNTGE